MKNQIQNESGKQENRSQTRRGEKKNFFSGTKGFLLSLLVIPLLFSGCANGHYATGNTIADATLTAAAAALTGELSGVADQVAAGSDIKTAFVNGSGTALNSLVGASSAVAAPMIAAQVKQWLPPTPQWETFAHNVGTILSNYVTQHGNTPQALQTALMAGANILNSY